MRPSSSEPEPVDQDTRLRLVADGTSALALLATAMAVAAVAPLPPWLAVAASLLVSGAVVWRFLGRNPWAAFGLANRVTLLRTNLVALMLLALWPAVPSPALLWTLSVVAVAVLALDGVDGWLARRRHEASAFGESFDMGADTAFTIILTLSLARFELVGPWVLALGLLRPLFVVASWRWPALAAPLPPRHSRKVACGGALALLAAALAPPLADIAPALAATALTALLWSFGRDLHHLLAGTSDRP